MRKIFALVVMTIFGSAAHADPYIGDLLVTGYSPSGGANFCPSGYLEANGQLLNINDYPALYSLLGTRYGGDGTNTFALPKLNPAYTASSGRPLLKQCIATTGIFPPRS